MTLIEISRSSIAAAIRRFEDAAEANSAKHKLEAEVEHLFACKEVRDYIPLIGDKLRAAMGGDEQAMILFSVLHLGINAGLHLAADALDAQEARADRAQERLAQVADLHARLGSILGREAADRQATGVAALKRRTES